MSIQQRLVLACTTAVMASTIASGARAQTTDAQGAASLEEITVTARKREESLSNVPVAVTAVTDEALERQQAIQVRDVAQMAPGLNITTDSPARAFITMRGIGITIINSVQPGVGVFVDGIYEPNTAYLNSPLVDAQRVEVLRGPQGTLFGSNTLGGAINVVTRQPSDTWQGRLNGTYAGSDNYRSAAGSVSGPIVPDLLQIGIGGAIHHQDGFMTNQLTGQDANPLDQDTIKGTVRLLPSSAAIFTLNVSYDRVKGGNTPYVLAAGPADYSLDPQENAIRGVVLNYIAANLKGEFDLAPFKTKLTVVGAFNELENQSYGDGDYGPIEFLNSAGASNEHTYTAEARFDTQWSENISTLIGVFAQHDFTSSTSTTTVLASNTNIYGSGFSKIQNKAAYGNLFWTLTEGWDLSAGLRVDHQTLNASNAQTAGAYTDTQVDPRVSLQHRWNADLMTYVSAARGSRGGGQNGPGAPNLIYQGDSVWTYELGTKFTAFDRRLSMNADVFYNNYSDFIGPNAIAPSTLGAGFVTVNLNAGHMISYGIEDELEFKLTNAFDVYGSLTYLHARVTNDDEYVKVAGYGLASNRIEFLPDWNFMVGANYEVPITKEDNLRFNVNEVAKGDRVGGTLDPTLVPMLAPYFLTNLSATYLHRNMEISLFASNLFDRKYLENYFDKSYLARAGFTGGLVQNLSIPGDRRRYGVRLGMKF